MVRAIKFGEIQGKRRVEEHIKRKWDTMPPQLKPLLLNERDSIFHPYPLGKRSHLIDLAAFWSSLIIKYTRVDYTMTMRNTSWFLASQYLTLGMVNHAKSLLLNGCFLEQCLLTPIEEIVKILPGSSNDDKISAITEGLHAIQTPRRIELFLLNHPHHLLNARDDIDVVNNISDDWNFSSGTNKLKPAFKMPEGAQMQIHFDDDSNKNKRHSFDIVSSITLKSLFKEYAENRGISLRSLRFSHRDRTLFLSSAGNKTPDALDMHDQDVICVHDTSIYQEPISSKSGTSTLTSNRAKAKSQRGVKKSKVIPKETPSRQEEPTKALEEWKSQHSRVLTKLHEEVQPRLGEIRKRLNELDLKCQPPKQKQKSKKKKKKHQDHDANSYVLTGSMIGGKAGKPCFIIHVGEVKNLYSTTKKCHSRQSHARTTIDLHGYTKNEALDALNKVLPEWVDSAMKGQYPWVIPVQVVCGCGNLLLSDTVKEWIKSTGNVSNAPKNSVV